jgi:hypothetical protein
MNPFFFISKMPPKLPKERASNQHSIEYFFGAANDTSIIQKTSKRASTSSTSTNKKLKSSASRFFEQSAKFIDLTNSQSSQDSLPSPPLSPGVIPDTEERFLCKFGRKPDPEKGIKGQHHWVPRHKHYFKQNGEPSALCLDHKKICHSDKNVKAQNKKGNPKVRFPL